MLMRGTTKHTRQQIKDELDRLKARVDRRRRRDARRRCSIETTRENLPAVAARWWPRSCASRRSRPTEFEQLQQEHLAAIEQQQQRAATRSRSNRVRAPHEPVPEGRRALRRRRSTSRSPSYKAATLDEAQPVLRATSTAPRNGRARDRRRLRRGRGDRSARRRALRRAGRARRRSRASPHALPGRRGRSTETLETPDKANAFFIAGHEPQRSATTTRTIPALVLGNYMLGGGFLNSRLATRHPPEGRPLLRRRLAALRPRPLDKAGSVHGVRDLRARRTRRSSRRRSRRSSRAC